MQFQTLIFAVFFVLVLSANWLLRRHDMPRKLLLVLASYYFYFHLSFTWLMPSILAGSSLLNYFCGEGIFKAREAGNKGAQRAWFRLGIWGNLLTLGVFKYYGFFQENVENVLGNFGMSSHLPILEIMLPVGLSFYTFQGLSYIMDLNRGKGVRANTVVDFLLYISFFPQLLSGPICRPKELLPQLHEGLPQSIPEPSRAVSLILSGLFKNVVLSHYLYMHIVGDVFLDPSDYSAASLWVGMFAYALYIYVDFSGYTDLAVGLSLLMGVSIPHNFNHPYLASDVSNFWGRWHMTLSRWINDYLFVALGGRDINKRWTALFWAWVLCGLWHGAAWNYILWGAYFAIALLIHHYLRSGIKKKWKGGVAGQIGTFIVVCFGWVIFASPDLETLWAYLTGLWRFSAPGEGFEAFVLVVLVLGAFMHIFGERIRNGFIRLHDGMPPLLRPVAWLAIGLVILALKPSGMSPNLYFGF
ncbi:MAG: MBOAT family protein [Planctomycetales bacterium]|nr:MBOAT family protein [bacterium]UNM09644.1 MAG: MBOAT family protein [Planctomycetales bacterium]